MGIPVDQGGGGWEEGVGQVRPRRVLYGPERALRPYVIEDARAAALLRVRVPRHRCGEAHNLSSEACNVFGEACNLFGEACDGTRLFTCMGRCPSRPIHPEPKFRV